MITEQFYDLMCEHYSEENIRKYSDALGWAVIPTGPFVIEWWKGFTGSYFRVIKGDLAAPQHGMSMKHLDADGVMAVINKCIDELTYGVLFEAKVSYGFGPEMTTQCIVEKEE